MTNHEEWFSNLEKSDLSGVVETKDDTPHPIKHIEDIPLSHIGQKGIMRNFLHVLTITKNLVFVRQIVDQGMQVWFTHLGYASSRTKAKSLHKGAEKGGWSSLR